MLIGTVLDELERRDHSSG